MFDALKWKTIDKRIQEKRLIILYKCLNASAPNYIRQLFQLTSEAHSYGLRSSSSNCLFIKGGSTQYHKRRFSYIAAQDWNLLLTPECRNAKSLNHFKRLIQEII